MAYCHHKTFLVKTEFEDELLYGIDNIKVTSNKIFQSEKLLKSNMEFIYIIHVMQMYLASYISVSIPINHAIFNVYMLAFLC